MRLSRIAVLALCNFVLLASVSIIFPLLPKLQDAYGLSTSQIGLVSASSFVAGLFAQLGLSRYVDRGYARHLLVGAALVSAASLWWLSFADVLWQLVAARFLGGLGFAAFGPAARALAVAEDPDAMGSNLARLSAGELAGIVVGPVFGALLYEWFGLAAPFRVLGTVAAVLAVPLLRVDLSRLPTREVGAPVATIGGIIARPAVQRAALLQLALYLPVGTYDVLWGRYLTDLGASSIFVGVSFSAYGIPYVLMALFGSGLIDRIGPVRAAVGGLIFTLPTVVAYGFFDRPGVMLAISLPEALANAIGAPAAMAAMALACRPHEVGTGQGLGGAMGIGAAAVAAITMAPIYDAAGALAAFGATAGAMAVIGALALLLGRRSDPSEVTQALVPG